MCHAAAKDFGGLMATRFLLVRAKYTTLSFPVCTDLSRELVKQQLPLGFH